MKPQKSDIVGLIEAANAKCVKRRQIISLVEWRLKRGWLIKTEEVALAAKYRCSAAFARKVLDGLVLCDVLIEISPNTYGPDPQNTDACIAMLMPHIPMDTTISTKDLWLKAHVEMKRARLDYLMKVMEGKGLIRKISNGSFCLPEAEIEKKPAKIKRKQRPMGPSVVVRFADFAERIAA